MASSQEHVVSSSTDEDLAQLEQGWPLRIQNEANPLGALPTFHSSPQLLFALNVCHLWPMEGQVILVMLDMRENLLEDARTGIVQMSYKRAPLCNQEPQSTSFNWQELHALSSINGAISLSDELCLSVQLRS